MTQVKSDVPISSFSTFLSSPAITQVFSFISSSFVMSVNWCGNLKIFSLGHTCNGFVILIILGLFSVPSKSSRT